MRPMTVKVGDSVLYGKYAGTEISVDGKEYLIMHRSDIFTNCLKAIKTKKKERNK